MKRRTLLQTAATLAGAGAIAAKAVATAQRPYAYSGPAPHTLHLAFTTPETVLDPPQTNSDENTSTLLSQILEAPLSYDYLARPVRLVPATAQALPEISPDGRTITLRIRPGIYFAHDPAFKGSPALDAQGRRELTAHDYVYSIKRFFDPRYASSDLYLFEEARLGGLDALRRRAIESRMPFDYDAPVEGLQAPDRYTLRIRMGESDPRWVYNLASPSLTGAVAREVVEFYGDRIGEHPVGTGPYRLAAWRRASRLELVRSESYQRGPYQPYQPSQADEARASSDPEPDAQQAQALQIAQRLKGRHLPLADRIVIDIMEEAQPLWLTFLQGRLDLIKEVPLSMLPVAVPGGRLAPFLQKKGVRLQSTLMPRMAMNYFQMEDPVVGGYAPHQVALRRAISLAFDGAQAIRLLNNGMALQAQSTIPPHTSGYDAGYASEMSQHSPARANALLDLYGYTDRNRDGWRELPDGQPLVLRMASLGSQQDRQTNEFWKRCLDAVGLKVEFEVATWPELLRRTRTGSLQIWGFRWTASSPDGGFFLSIAYGPNAGDSNDPRFALPAFDRLYEQQKRLPDGPQRTALMRRAKDLLVAYMPYKVHRHDVVAALSQPWLHNHLSHPFMRDTWRFLESDLQRSP